MQRVVLTLLGALVGLVLLVEVFVRSPLLAAVLAAAGIALFDYWRRRGIMR